MESNFLGVITSLPVWYASKLSGTSQMGKMGEIPTSGTHRRQWCESRGSWWSGLNKGREIFPPLVSHQVKSLQRAQGASWTLQFGFAPDMKYGKALLMQHFHHHCCFAFFISVKRYNTDSCNFSLWLPCWHNYLHGNSEDFGIKGHVDVIIKKLYLCPQRPCLVWEQPDLAPTPHSVLSGYVL